MVFLWSVEIFKLTQWADRIIQIEEFLKIFSIYQVECVMIECLYAFRNVSVLTSSLSLYVIWRNITTHNKFRVSFSLSNRWVRGGSSWLLLGSASKTFFVWHDFPHMILLNFIEFYSNFEPQCLSEPHYSNNSGHFYSNSRQLENGVAYEKSVGLMGGWKVN